MIKICRNDLTTDALAEQITEFEKTIRLGVNIERTFSFAIVINGLLIMGDEPPFIIDPAYYEEHGGDSRDLQELTLRLFGAGLSCDTIITVHESWATELVTACPACNHKPTSNPTIDDLKSYKNKQCPQCKNPLDSKRKESLIVQTNTRTKQLLHGLEILRDNDRNVTGYVEMMNGEAGDGARFTRFWDKNRLERWMISPFVILLADLLEMFNRPLPPNHKTVQMVADELMKRGTIKVAGMSQNFVDAMTQAKEKYR